MPSLADRVLNALGLQKRAVSLSDVGVNPRPGMRRGAVNVTSDTALRHSAVWACLRIRADLVSTFPVDVFRKVGGIDVEVSKPPVLVDPGGTHWPYIHWMWASQFELDRGGNTIGLITERNALGLPARIDLQPIDRCAVFQRKDMAEHRYRIDGKEYTPDQVWHERQFPVPGLPVGLSPVAYAAWTLSEALSMQQFALDWFSGGGVPKARLHNTKRSLEAGPDTNEARRIKDRYAATIANGDIFVHGNDWELDFLQGEQMGIEWLDGRRAAIPDIARFFGCPVDLIEAAISAPGSPQHAQEHAADRAVVIHRGGHREPPGRAAGEAEQGGELERAGGGPRVADQGGHGDHLVDLAEHLVHCVALHRAENRIRGGQCHRRHPARVPGGGEHPAQALDQGGPGAAGQRQPGLHGQHPGQRRPSGSRGLEEQHRAALPERRRGAVTTVQQFPRRAVLLGRAAHDPAGPPGGEQPAGVPQHREPGRPTTRDRRVGTGEPVPDRALRGGAVHQRERHERGVDEVRLAPHQGLPGEVELGLHAAAGGAQHDAGPGVGLDVLQHPAGGADRQRAGPVHRSGALVAELAGDVEVRHEVRGRATPLA